MRLVIEKRAARRLLGLPPRVQVALLERLKAIAAAPFGRHANVRPLAGATDVFRLRVGDWRAVYRLDRVAGSMHVRLIEPRGSAYR